MNSLFFKRVRQSSVRLPSIYTSYPRNESCPCGSNIKAKNCCLTPGGLWNKNPANIIPQGEATNIENAKCYVRDEHNCSDNISQEHCVSKSVLKTLADENYTILVQGMSWIPKGESKALPIQRLTAKVLCERHNNALSPIDKEFGRFISTIGSFDDKFKADQQNDEIAIFCGEDLEKWMLKTICCKVASGAIGKDGIKTNIKMNSAWIDILYGHKPWPQLWGLYIDMSNEQIEHKKSFSVRPLVAKDNNDLLAAEVYVNKLKFNLLLGNPDPPESFGVRRPRTLIFQSFKSSKVIEVSWKDKSLNHQILLNREKRTIF